MISQPDEVAERTHPARPSLRHSRRSRPLRMPRSQGDRLKFAVDLAPAVREADAVFVAVGTPSRRGDGHADLSYVYEAAQEIARAMEGFTVVITKSTVPVGTGDEVERILRETRPDSEGAGVCT